MTNRPFSKTKMDIRKFRGAWHVHCGLCQTFVCWLCTSPAPASQYTHRDAVITTETHMAEYHGVRK